MKVEMTDDLKDLYETGQSKRYKDVSRNRTLLAVFVRAIKIMEQAPSSDSLKEFSFLHYEKLCYQLSGKSSVRLSNQYAHRLIFTETEDGLQVELIEIDDTHYGNK